MKRLFLMAFIVFSLSLLLQACNGQQATTGISMAASLKRLDTQTPVVKNILVEEVRPMMQEEEQKRLDTLLSNAEILSTQIRFMISSHEAGDLVLLALQARPFIDAGRGLVEQGDLIISPVMSKLPLATQIELRRYRSDLIRLGQLIDIVEQSIETSTEALNWAEVLRDIATITSGLAPLTL